MFCLADSRHRWETTSPAQTIYSNTVDINRVEYRGAGEGYPLLPTD
jgi:hypothetical protein